MDDPADPEAESLIDELDVSAPGLRVNGPLRRAFYCEYARDLTEADHAALALPRGIKAQSLKRIHASHHSLARCLATGMKPAQAALVTGYALGRIQGLLVDPAFTALVEDYRNEAKSIFADLAERMNDMSLDAIELLQERLHESPESFTVPMLLDVVKAFADRTGHGPNQEVNLKVSTDLVDRPPRETFEEWEARRKRALEAPVGPGLEDSLDVPGPKALKDLN